jgi:hypothetical protein
MPNILYAAAGVEVRGDAKQAPVPVIDNDQSFNVQVEVGFFASTGLVYATFRSIDPNTSLPPDVLTGFLPPEDGTGRGKGFITYSVQPKSGLPTGTQIRNVAFVTFDQNEAVSTDQVNDEDPSQGVDLNKQDLNTIDSVPPTSSVSTLPASSSYGFQLQWSGQDDAGGSGVANYDIYYSTDGGPFVSWLQQTSLTRASFTGDAGHTYSFYSLARDNVGNVETAPTTAEATTSVVAGPLIVTGTSGNDTIGVSQDQTNLSVSVNGGAPVITKLSHITSFTLDSGGGTDSLSFTGQAGGPVGVVQLIGTFNITSDVGGWGIQAGGNSVINLSGSQHLASLDLSGNATASVAPNGNNALKTRSLQISGNAVLDLNDNDLIVQADAGTKAAVLAVISTDIRVGRKNGSWNGIGGIVSSAAAAKPNKLTGLAVVVNVKSGGSPLYAAFDGEPVDVNSILVKYTYNGDADLSGKIDADDYFLIDSGFASKLAGYRNGDFDFNGVIDADDYFLIDRAFAGQTGALAATEAAAPAKHARGRHHHRAGHGANH